MSTDPKIKQTAFLAELCRQVNVDPSTLAQIEELCVPKVVKQFGVRNALLKDLASVRVANLMADQSLVYYKAVEEAFSEAKIRKVAEELFRDNGKKIVMELAAMEDWGGNLQMKSYDRFTSTTLYKNLVSQFQPVLEEVLLPILIKALEELKTKDFSRLQSELVRSYHNHIKEKLTGLIHAKADADAKELFELMQVNMDEIRTNAAAIARLKAASEPEDEILIPE